MFKIRSNRLLRVSADENVTDLVELQSVIFGKLVIYPCIQGWAWLVNAQVFLYFDPNFKDKVTRFNLFTLIGYMFSCLQGLFTTIAFFINQPEIRKALVGSISSFFVTDIQLRPLQNDPPQNDLQLHQLPATIVHQSVVTDSTTEKFNSEQAVAQSIQ